MPRNAKEELKLKMRAAADELQPLIHQLQVDLERSSESTPQILDEIGKSHTKLKQLHALLLEAQETPKK